MQTETLSRRPTIAMPLFDTEQPAQLERVKWRLDPLVLNFFAERRPGDQFHVNDLIRYVWRFDPFATATSPDRVMRELKSSGRLNYELVSRSQSLYRVTEASEVEND